MKDDRVEGNNNHSTVFQAELSTTFNAMTMMTDRMCVAVQQ